MLPRATFYFAGKNIALGKVLLTRATSCLFAQGRMDCNRCCLTYLHAFTFSVVDRELEFLTVVGCDTQPKKLQKNQPPPLPSEMKCYLCPTEKRAKVNSKFVWKHINNHLSNQRSAQYLQGRVKAWAEWAMDLGLLKAHGPGALEG